MQIPCCVRSLPKLSKSLKGIGADPLNIDVVVIGNLNVLPSYLQARDYVERITGKKLTFNLIYQPETELKVKTHIGFYTIQVEQESLFFVNSSATGRQMIYDSRPYQQKYDKPFYSAAWYGGKGNIQYSQVIYPTIWIEVLHELCHGWYSFFDLPDNTHKYLYEIKDGAQVTVEEAFPKILGEIFPSKKLPLLFHLPAPKKKR